MKQLLIVAVAVFMAIPVSYAGITYKCESPSGSISWQDSPCESGKELSRKRMRDYSRENASKKGHGELTATQANQLIRLKKIKIGMSKKDVIKSWGVPSKTLVSMTAQERSERLVYYNYSEVPVVMVARGVVTAINYSKAKPKSAKPSKSLGTVNSSGYGQYNKQ
ncbi:hypothetical protein Ga0123461_1548 [Mariprofundus aestuarium]|uniref:DUF4124 domain-containing protein n=1 Tax=Mariprofundus aestuarium TaxID=1921086 RepID=A0A2K8KYV7_MARES|nr:hypothetical protein [Mariprofundus aestuarium]ATX79962.1 hypothetical protein Ga0123461_1548 [Mariprofundus aestuarium]